MNNIPQWDLENIYPSPSSAEFSEDILKLEKTGKALCEAAEDGASDTYDLIRLRDEGAAIAVNLTAYSSALLSTDSSSSEFLSAVSRSEAAEAEFSKAEDAFIRAVRDDDSFPPEYSYFVSEIISRQSHLMSPEEEALAADLSVPGPSLWEHLQENLASSISDGETLTSLRSLASDDDRNVRKKAYERETALLRRHASAFAHALSGVKGSVALLDGRRGWKSPLERSLSESRTDEVTFNALIGAIEDSLPLFHEYFRIKARILGIDDFSFFDLFAPVGGNGRKYTFSDAAGIVLSSFSSFSPELGDFADRAVSSGWIDALMHEGKAGGAYDTYFPLRGESRVFMNFDGSYDSVLTLSHELGHAYHDHVLSALPMSLASYPMTLAETASTFSEKLVFQNIVENSSGPDAMFAVEQFLQSAAQTIVDIYSRYLFERSVFERITEGSLTADECCSLMLDAQNRAYGDALSVKHPYMWAVKSHYYSADFSYYNYPYAFGELFALSLFQRRTEEGFAEKYRNLLEYTGRAGAKDVAASISFDITKRDFWQSGIDFIASNIERLGKWL